MASDPLTLAREEISRRYLADEDRVVNDLIDRVHLTPAERNRIDVMARGFVGKVRAQRRHSGLDAFLHQYSLTSAEGVVLMCLAEALLRVPDAATVDRLIRDKLDRADWERHIGRSPSLFVNAATWGLMLTGRILRAGTDRADWASIFGRIVGRSGEPVIREAIVAGMRIIGRQFVLGQTIAEALRRAEEWKKRGYRLSFDMLGEAAVTADDADRYYAAHEAAIAAVAAVGPRADDAIQDVWTRNSVSVKLSALHPRFEYAQRERVMTELLPRFVALARAARDAGTGLTIDAEESDRLDLQLDVFAAALADRDIRDWDGLGLAVQAYGKRAVPIIQWLGELAQARKQRIPVRLVKGAYWDLEIKRAQEQGLAGYPVFTRKAATDLSYLACARALLASPRSFFPMFATHNAHTLAAVRTLAGRQSEYEFQRLHGMGEELYEALMDQAEVACRIYAPVGSHDDLLPYLVRRLLENGANTSFVNRLADDEAPIEDIIADPVERMRSLDSKANPRIPLPTGMFPNRVNSRGILLSDPAEAEPFLAEIARTLDGGVAAMPLIDGEGQPGSAVPVRDPADRRRQVGSVVPGTPAQLELAMARVLAATSSWDAAGGDSRATILERAADLYERDRALLVGLCVREGGKTVSAGLAEVREAVDFLRYYALLARAEFASPLQLPGPTGERNELSLHGRGVFACISPWNFPVAIFTGQIAGALAAGNGVIAKPAEQTPLTAFACTRLLHEAGVPGGVLHLVPGDGPLIGGVLSRHADIAGVAFTGSTAVAQQINRALASRGGPLPTLIAETGGVNAMIADSTALPEQLVWDVITSAFDSGGQRCSALRVLFLQKDIAPRVLELLAGAIRELRVGDPMRLDTDIGPVIDRGAQEALNAHAARMDREGRLVAEVPLPGACDAGTFFAPRAYEIDAIARLHGEVFGPILHVVRYEASRLGEVCEAINATGYGLTLGVHSRIDDTVDFVRARVRVGNLYVNRSQIGAVVGVQPFGGEGLSGTGPKAGGPHYLHRFAVERVVSTNTTAAGGNASLLSLE